MYPEQIAAREIAGLEAEIERLRTRIKVADKEAAAETSYLRGEVERLRAALRYYASGITERGDIARAVLGADEQISIKEEE